MKRYALALLLAIGGAHAENISTATCDPVFQGYQNAWIIGVSMEGAAYNSSGAQISLKAMNGSGQQVFKKTCDPTACPASTALHDWSNKSCFQCNLLQADTAVPGSYTLYIDTVKGAGHDPVKCSWQIK